MYGFAVVLLLMVRMLFIHLNTAKEKKRAKLGVPINQLRTKDVENILGLRLPFGH